MESGWRSRSVHVEERGRERPWGKGKGMVTYAVSA